MKKVTLFSQVTRAVYPAISYGEQEQVLTGAMGAFKTKKIVQTWADKEITIKKGLHDYDESVLEIKAVKDLIKANLVIIKSEPKNEETTQPKTTGRGRSNKNKSLADTADEMEQEEAPEAPETK